MTKRKIREQIISFIIISTYFFLCLVSGIRTVKAETVEATEEEIMQEIQLHRNGIVRVESICWDGDSEVYAIKSFSGFVASCDSAGICVITIHNNLTYSSEEKENIKIQFELENNTRISEKIEVVFNGDVRIQANIEGESEQRNLTVLKLDKNINFENFFQFAKENVLDKERVFLLSYPEASEPEYAVYNTENALITSGIVLNNYQTDEIPFFHHNIQTDQCSIGGPLVNADGAVAGVLLSSYGEEEGVAISCEALKAFLATFNIGYQEYEEMIVEKKLPVLNIVLGVVIIILLMTVISGIVKSKFGQEKENSNVSGTEKSRKKKGEAYKNKNEKRGTLGKNVNASLEYPAAKRMVIIRKAQFVIGREKNADFVFPASKGISRKHAVIQFDGKEFYLMDLQSTNHTFLNGSELVSGEKRRMKDGDEVMVGKEKMIFRRNG